MASLVKACIRQGLYVPLVPTAGLKWLPAQGLRGLDTDGEIFHHFNKGDNFLFALLLTKTLLKSGLF